MRHGRVAVAMLVVAIAGACDSGPATPSGHLTPPPSVRPTAAPSVRPTAAPSASIIPEPADLSPRPLVWFAPLPPLPTGPGREFVGSVDFMQLFDPGAPWDRAASYTEVFKLYGEWVAYSATDDQLRSAIAGIAARGQVLAVEMGPLDASPTCGQGVESFAGIDEGRLISRRIREAGGTLQVIAMDEPYFYGHVFDGADACHWPVADVAGGVASFVAAMRGEWPALVVGDTEPMPAPVTAADLGEWLDAYRSAVGEPSAFLHLDMDWGRSDWPALGAAVRQVGAARQVPVGMIYNGGAATSDAQWLATTGKRVLSDEAAAGGAPDHVLFQSWMDKPDRVLPENDPATFTSLIDRYFDDHANLAQVPGGARNLALGRPATASSSIGGSSPGKAVDGDPDTLWSAGTGAPSWIRINLGDGARVSSIRLTVSQSPAGETRHRVTCAAAGGPAKVVATLAGTTADLDVLSVKLVNPVACSILRIDTLASPSWVAWREVEVFGD